MERLIRANLHYLQQAVALLDCLDDGLFSQPVANFYGSSVGGHLRHCVEHYLSFLAGMDSGRVDYDDRKREVRLETVTGEAAEALRRIMDGLSGLLGGEPPMGLHVKMDCGGDEIEWQPSTIGRELQFLVSHTVHHFAMIGGICRALEVGLEENFGVAPSTIRHRARVGAS
jgi:hypothetical protein